MTFSEGSPIKPSRGGKTSSSKCPMSVTGSSNRELVNPRRLERTFMAFQMYARFCRTLDLEKKGLRVGGCWKVHLRLTFMDIFFGANIDMNMKKNRAKKIDALVLVLDVMTFLI